MTDDQPNIPQLTLKISQDIDNLLTLILAAMDELEHDPERRLDYEDAFDAASSASMNITTIMAELRRINAA